MLNLEWLTLQWVLEQLITKGLPMGGIWWLLSTPVIKEWFDAVVKPFVETKLGIDGGAFKRYVALALSVIVSDLLYYLYASLGYVPMPNGFEAWADVTITLGATNFAGTQVLHAALGMGKHKRH